MRGGFGLFLEEVLVNAMRHGRPGTAPRLGLHVDRRLLERLALLFGWQGLTFEESGGRFVVSWRVPVSEREEEGEAD